MRVVLYRSVFPVRSETFIVEQLRRLVEGGVDAHLLCHHFDEPTWATMPAASSCPELAARVHRASAPHRYPTTTARHVVAAARRLVTQRPGDSTSKDLRREPPPGCSDAPAGTDPDRRLTSRFVDAARAASTAAQIEALRPDVLHIEMGWEAQELAGALAPLEVPTVVSLRGAEICFMGLDRPGCYDVLWSSIDAVHVVSADLGRRATERGLPPEVPVRVITPSVDASRFVPVIRDRGVLGAAGRPLSLLSVGRLVWKKGHHDAIAAVGVLAEHGVHTRLRIAGDGPLMRPLRLAVDQQGLSDRVELLGQVPAMSVTDELARADVLVHPSLSEGFCNAVLEAQATGLPVVCTDAEGLADNIEPDVTGLIVPRREPAAIAGALAELAADPQRRADMGRLGRARIETDFRPEGLAAGFAELYELAHHRRRRRSSTV